MKLVKILLLALLTISFATSIQAQEDKAKRPSPPAETTATIGGVDLAINYSSPAIKGRKLYGKLIPGGGKLWRTGANEATTFEVTKDVTIEGKALPAGKYALFTIGSPEEWTIILNSEADQWGPYNYNKEKDVLRVNVKPGKADAFAERFVINAGDDGKVLLHWGDIAVTFVVAAK